jgi:exoribonuclease II
VVERLDAVEAPADSGSDESQDEDDEVSGPIAIAVDVNEAPAGASDNSAP